MSESNDDEKMKRKPYEAELHEPQVQLCHRQDWIRETRHRVTVIFEGRDAAGKGGTIRALTERVGARVRRRASARPDAGLHGRRIFAVVRRQFERQEACPAEM